MPGAEILLRKAETLPPELFEEAVNYIDYLSQKAQAANFAEKLSEAERRQRPAYLCADRAAPVL